MGARLCTGRLGGGEKAICSLDVYWIAVIGRRGRARRKNWWRRDWWRRGSDRTGIGGINDRDCVGAASRFH